MNRNEMHDIGNHELLTGTDEKLLARYHQVGMHLQTQKDTLSEELGRECTDKEIGDLLQMSEQDVDFLISRGRDAKDRIVRENMRLVFHIAKFYKDKGMSFPDLVQEGTAGLLKAVDRYDPERGFRISTYASWWIKQSVSRAVAEKSRLIRLPVHIHDMLQSMLKTEAEFQQAKGRMPTLKETADKMGLPESKLEILQKSKREIKSTDEEAFKNQRAGRAEQGQSARQLGALLESEEGYQEESLADVRGDSLRQDIRRSMSHLTEREVRVVELRFGLLNGNSMTLEEIGRTINVTRERVRQIEARALHKLRQPDNVSQMKNIFRDYSEAVFVRDAQAQSEAQVQADAGANKGRNSGKRGAKPRKKSQRFKNALSLDKDSTGIGIVSAPPSPSSLPQSEIELKTKVNTNTDPRAGAGTGAGTSRLDAVEGARKHTSPADHLLDQDVGEAVGALKSVMRETVSTQP
jgi:RNA polymerase sigma factor (sigma-70 family)